MDDFLLLATVSGIIIGCALSDLLPALKNGLGTSQSLDMSLTELNVIGMPMFLPNRTTGYDVCTKSLLIVSISTFINFALFFSASDITTLLSTPILSNSGSKYFTIS